jgi:DNA-binding response OmpR family regulator
VRLLVVEDEPRVAAFLVKGLRAQGYAVEAVATGREALQRAQDGFDLVVLDLGLPDMDGTEVLRRLRAEGISVPVIVLTARGDVHDRIQGLDLGADDYVTKPFAFGELLARIRARLRASSRTPRTVLEAGKIRLDLQTRRAYVGDRAVDLTAREFALLAALMHRPGQVLSREQLLSRVWGIQFDPGSNVVDVYISLLRKKLGEEVIETVRGVGYRIATD